MRFNPKSEAELGVSSGFEPFPAGVYDYEVIGAVDKVSKSSGNEMVELKVAIFDTQGHKRHVFDYLVASEGGLKKVRAFAESAGLLDAYDRGEMTADDMIGRTGQCKVNVERNEEFGDRNKIAFYNKPKAAAGPVRFSAPKRAAYSAPADLDDAVPFAPCWQ